jgi:hypothetical protein
MDVESSELFKSPKEVLMYYHSTLRNVGLFTTVSFGSLAYSRYYRGKSKLYAGGLVAISIAFLAISFFINHALNGVIQRYNKQEKNYHISSLIFISSAIYYVQLVLFALSTWTLYRMIINDIFV